MKKGWNFPDNNNGQIVGISEAGIETFKGSPITSLAREICQNSLDARKNSESPVKVEFKLDVVKVNEIDKFDELKKAIIQCKDFWTKNKNEKTVKFFENAVNTASQDYIRILRISYFSKKYFIILYRKRNTRDICRMS